MKHLSRMTDFRASASLRALSQLKRGECFFKHMSAAGDKRTLAVITLQHRLFHEVSPRDFTRCFSNRHLRACSPFACSRLGARTKTCVSERKYHGDAFRNISSCESHGLRSHNLTVFDPRLSPGAFRRSVSQPRGFFLR